MLTIAIFRAVLLCYVFKFFNVKYIMKNELIRMSREKNK